MLFPLPLIKRAQKDNNWGWSVWLVQRIWMISCYNVTEHLNINMNVEWNVQMLLLMMMMMLRWRKKEKKKKEEEEEEEEEGCENAEIGDIYVLCHIVLPQIPCTYGCVLVTALSANQSDMDTMVFLALWIEKSCCCCCFCSFLRPRDLIASVFCLA